MLVFWEHQNSYLFPLCHPHPPPTSTLTDADDADVNSVTLLHRDLTPQTEQHSEAEPLGFFYLSHKDIWIITGEWL